ncbi:hypothetical protein HYZ80_02050 [Candidatus Parcubacteria bacterium]|nr:hypothetical protein [Candidatus Parcubacteria bacterium]
MNWLLFALSAYFLNAVATTVDSILLRRRIPEPLTYTTYVGLVSIFALVLAPWGFGVPSAGLAVLSILTGCVFLGSLAVIFQLLKSFEPSRSAAVAGTATVLILLAAERLLMGTTFTSAELAAVVLLLGGIFLLTHRSSGAAQRGRFMRLTLAAGGLGALYLFLAKIVFGALGFVNGFIWTRLGAFLGALVLWLVLRLRGRGEPMPAASALVLANRTVAGVGSVLMNGAVALASPALVSALRGSEYAFLFLLAFALSAFAPQLLQEELRAKRVVEKIAGLVSVAFGLALLTFGKP